MALLWITLITMATFLLTITVVVISQELHPVAGFATFALVVWVAFKIFQNRFTRL